MTGHETAIVAELDGNLLDAICKTVEIDRDRLLLAFVFLLRTLLFLLLVALFLLAFLDRPPRPNAAGRAASRPGAVPARTGLRRDRPGSSIRDCQCAGRTRANPRRTGSCPRDPRSVRCRPYTHPSRASTGPTPRTRCTANRTRSDRSWSRPDNASRATTRNRVAVRDLRRQPLPWRDPRPSTRRASRPCPSRRCACHRARTSGRTAWPSTRP